MSMVVTHFNDPAWRGMGKAVTATTIKEVLEQSELDWPVLTQKLLRVSEVGEQTPLGQWLATVRQDTDRPLGVVGVGYRVVQNRQAFEFFDQVVREGDAQYMAAGILDGGQRVWVQAKWDGDADIVPGDTIHKMLLLHTSHDGGSSLRLLLTPVRVVCENTLNMALSGAGRSGIAIRHSGDIDVKFGEARKALELVGKYYDDFVTAGKSLAHVQVSRQRLTALLDKAVPITVRKDGEESGRTKAVREDIVRLFESGRGIDRPGVRGTAWAFVNAVTEHVDYSRGTRGETDEERKNNRLDSIWFGSGAHLKARAWDAALAMVRT